MLRYTLKTLKSKFIASMLLITFVPILIQTMTSMNTSMSILENNYIDSHVSSLSTSSRNMDLIFAPILSVNRMLLSDNTLMKILNQFPDKNNISSYDMINIEKSFSSIIAPNQYIDSIYFIANNGQIYYYAKNSSVSEMVKKINLEQLKKETWYSDTIEAEGKETFFCGDVFNSTVDQRYFTSTKLIKDTNNVFKNYGIIVMSLRSSMIKNVFPNSAIYDNEKFVIFDKKTGWYYSDSGSDELLAVVKESSNKNASGGIYKNNKYIISRVSNSTTDWELFNIIERDVLDKKTRKIALNSILLSTVMLLVVILIMVFISDAINKPVKKVKKLIDEFALGNRNITEEFDDSEIGCIGNQFKLVVNNNIELNERLMLSRVKQREAEIMVLQEQINPHFLYNTLDSLYWMAAINDQQEIAEMIVSLSALFKLTLNNGEMLIEVSKEVEHIYHYLKIQNMRYGDRLTTHIDFDEDILQKKVLNLILQPIVENAICHGIEPVVGGGSVWVTGKRHEDNLIFTVRDNGVGMETLNMDKGYGILNVKERIRLFYGEDSDFQINSEKGKGTEVTIKVREVF